MEISQTDAHSAGLTGTVSPPYLQCVCSQVVARVAEADNAIQTSVRPPGNQTASLGAASVHPDCLPHSARAPPRYNACPACVLGAGKLSTGGQSRILWVGLCRKNGTLTDDIKKRDPLHLAYSARRSCWLSALRGVGWLVAGCTLITSSAPAQNFGSGTCRACARDVCGRRG